MFLFWWKSYKEFIINEVKVFLKIVFHLSILIFDFDFDCDFIFFNSFLINISLFNYLSFNILLNSSLKSLVY